MVEIILPRESAGRLLRYAHDPEKGARVLCGNVPGQAVDEIERVFESFDQVGPRLRHPAMHVILALHDDDAARLSLSDRRDIVHRTASAHGMVLSPWVAIEHERDDVGEPCEWHVHLVGLQKDAFGNRVSDSYSRLVGRALMVGIEEEKNLIRTPFRAAERSPGRTRSGAVDEELARAYAEMRHVIRRAADLARDLSDFIRRLDVHSLKVRFAVDRGEIVGIGFRYERRGRKVQVRGGELGADFTWRALQRTPALRYDPVAHAELSPQLQPVRPKPRRLIHDSPDHPGLGSVLERMSMIHPSLAIAPSVPPGIVPHRGGNWDR